MKKFKLSYIAVLVLWLISITSCKQNKSEISIIGENTPNFEAVISQKELMEEKLAIKLSFQPNTVEDLMNKANHDFLNGTSNYDIVMGPNLNVSSYVTNNYILKPEELNELNDSVLFDFEQDIFLNVLEEVGSYYKDPASNKGIEIVSYPFTALTQILVYNKIFFSNQENKVLYRKRYNEELVVPTTWEQYYNIAEFFTNKENDTYGVCLEGASNMWAYTDWVNYAYSFNGGIIDKDYGWQSGLDTKLIINSPENIEATNFYLSLKPFNSGGYFNVDFVEKNNIMKQGKTAMAIVWADAVYDLAYENGVINNTFGFAPIPGKVSSLLGGSFYINRKTKNNEDIAKFLNYFFEESTQIELVKNGLIPTVKSVYQLPELKDIPYLKAIEESLDRGVYMFEGSVETDMIIEYVNNMLQRIWRGEIGVEEALNKAQIEIQKRREKIYKIANRQ